MPGAMAETKSHTGVAVEVKPLDYFEKITKSPDSALRAEWPVGPWPAPWFRGLHSWSMWFATEPGVSPMMAMYAPWVSVVMGLLEVFIMCCLTTEITMPVCTSYKGHGDCQNGMFCEVADRASHTVGGLCLDCKYSREGEHMNGDPLSAALAASAAIQCANDDPDSCDALNDRRVTIAAFIVGLVYLFIFPQSILKQMDQTANEELMFNYRVKKNEAALGWRASYGKLAYIFVTCIRNCVLPPVLAMTTAAFLAGSSTYGARGLTVAFLTFASILKIDQFFLYLFVHGRSFDDAAFKADLAEARKQAPFNGLSLAFLGRRFFGLGAIIYICIYTFDTHNVTEAIMGTTECNKVLDGMMYGALVLVALHGGTAVFAKPLLEDSALPKTAGTFAFLSVKAVIGVVMGGGIFLAMVQLAMALSKEVMYV